MFFSSRGPPPPAPRPRPPGGPASLARPLGPPPPRLASPRPAAAARCRGRCEEAAPADRAVCERRPDSCSKWSGSPGAGAHVPFGWRGSGREGFAAPPARLRGRGLWSCHCLRDPDIMLGSLFTASPFCLSQSAERERERKPFCGMVCTSEIQPAPVCSRGKEILTSFENYQQTTNADFLGLWRPPCSRFCCFLDGFFNLWSAPLSTHCGDPKDSVLERSDRWCSELELIPSRPPLSAQTLASESQSHVSPGARTLFPLYGELIQLEDLQLSQT